MRDAIASIELPRKYNYILIVACHANDGRLGELRHQLHVLILDCDTLGVDGAHVRSFNKSAERSYMFIRVN